MLARPEFGGRRTLAGDAGYLVSQQRRDRIGSAQSLEATEFAPEALALILVEQFRNAERARRPVRRMQRLRRILRPVRISSTAPDQPPRLRAHSAALSSVSEVNLFSLRQCE